MKNVVIRLRRFFSPSNIVIEGIDEKFLIAQLSVAMKAYEESGHPHAGALENLVGIVGADTFDGLLNDYLHLAQGVDYEWNTRKANNWKEGSDRVHGILSLLKAD